MIKATINDFRIHDLRHAYASFAINAGFSLKAIGENLGHARASTTERYAHLLLDARRPVSEVVANAYKGTTAAQLNGSNAFPVAALPEPGHRPKPHSQGRASLNQRAAKRA